MTEGFLSRSFGLAGRVALITGGAGGLGLATARTLAEAGAAVVLADQDGQAAETAAAGLRALGFEASAQVFDVADGEGAAVGIAAAAKRHGRLDIAFSNAGNQDRRPFETFSGDGWRRILDVHVNGAFEVLRHAMPHLRASGDGRAILMSSVTAFGTAPGSTVTAYATAKGALAAMTRALAVEYGPQGVTVNAVAPGYVRTGFTRAMHDDPGFEAWLARQVPQGGWIDAQAVASAVLYLASPAARAVTGIVLPVDGGLTAAL